MGSGTTRIGGLFGVAFLGLAVWLYHFSQIGSSALIFATAYVVWRTGVLPKWSTALAVLGVPSLLHVWIGLTGLLLLVLPPVVHVSTKAAK